MGKGSGRPGGNPDFGNKYRAPKKIEQTLSEQVGTRVAAETKSQLKLLADKKNCSVPDLVRAAIEQYLASNEENCVA